MDNLDVNMSFEEAENRLHAHKAVLWQVMKPTSEFGKYFSAGKPPAQKISPREIAGLFYICGYGNLYFSAC